MHTLETIGHERHNQIHLAVQPRAVWLLSVALLALWLALLVWCAYRAPLELSYDVGSERAPIRGAYGNEHNDEFSYIYADDNVSLLVPQVDARMGIVQLRLGGPGTAIPVAAQIHAAGRMLDLGAVQTARTYHMLIPADGQGSLRMTLESAVTKVPGDRRRLGVLIDSFSISSTRTPAAPLFVLWASLIGLVASGVAMANTRIRRPWQLALTALLATLVTVGITAARGRIELPPLWWLGAAALFGVTGAVIARSRWLETARPFVAVAVMFAVWRLGMWLIAAFGLWFSSALGQLALALSRDGNRYDRPNIVWNTFVQGWVQWDSEHYTTIATTGYMFQGVRWPNIAFFPLYPMLMKLFAPLVQGNTNLAGVIVANVAFLAALLVLYDLVVRDVGRRVAQDSVLFALIIPTSCFFAAAYSESLALLLAVAAVWAIRRQRWWWAGALGFCLALTRVPGVVIAPVLAIAYIQSRQWNWRAVRWPILAAGLPPLGLVVFMAFQWTKFGTPFAFMQAQQAWENELSPPWTMPVNLYGGITTSPDWPIIAFQALFYVTFIVLTIAALRRLPLVYGLTMALLLIPPFMSSWVWSTSRHVLIGFAGYVVLAIWAQRRWARWLLLAIMLPLLVLATLLFVNGYWIA